ncbi:hypothetical protein [Jiangella sp. DSM 45060]|uniref:hypothetical protein n=1 Tax=Jiangella sp. DSM 45060 TaxID=1798224 RepID=UPI00087DB2EB|nr:hypothetical protein [Jiangella sp. DSM 45060]SDT65102.1 hypothetical protein SAMN04515669_5464 [Jiangella sp. DSM 45060]
MRMRGIAAAVAVSAVLLTGCEAPGEPPLGLLDIDDAESGTVTGEPTTDASDPPTADPSGPADGDWALEVGGAPPEAPADLAVFEAYLAFWRADLTAVSLPDPAHQPLLDLSADPQRQRVVDVASRLLADGHRTIGTLRLAPLVVSVSGPTAAIQDCLDGRDTYDVDADGAEVADSRGDLLPVLVQLAADGDAWVVADVQESDHDCG